MSAAGIEAGAETGSVPGIAAAAGIPVAAGTEAEADNEASLVCHFELPYRCLDSRSRHRYGILDLGSTFRAEFGACFKCTAHSACRTSCFSLSNTAHHRMCVPISGTADSMLSPWRFHSCTCETPVYRGGGVHLLKGHGDCR
ncbi:hypothetical protein BBB_1416 [Bifidobacterium bifidum BGN4]|uniref:Uncharacterized protein n=1 Tax=Bifidobacterium bifidum BGN4 TaxID=484020 RepID=I3WJE4_BIFBI|nr:hypothetical protein BBB_1416 [Bifidobacterium bifidum BGN4]